MTDASGQPPTTGSPHAVSSAPRTSAASDVFQGQVVAGKYQLLNLLGRGGMGAVYEARNNATYKRCAVKLLLSPELVHNEELVQRFFREAQASSIIETVVQVYDSRRRSPEKPSGPKLESDRGEFK